MVTRKFNTRTHQLIEIEISFKGRFKSFYTSKNKGVDGY